MKALMEEVLVIFITVWGLFTVGLVSYHVASGGMDLVFIHNGTYFNAMKK